LCGPFYWVFTFSKVIAYNRIRRRAMPSQLNYGVHTMKVSEARINVGGLSKASKMPARSYGLPAQACKIGGTLRAVKGSTCENCYAYDRGMYVMPVVKSAQARRLATITRDDWAASMARAINKINIFAGTIPATFKALTTSLKSLKWLDSLPIVCTGCQQEKRRLSRHIPAISRTILLSAYPLQ
jgi:hypothetical protein